MIRLFLLTLAISLALLAGFEILRSLPWLLEVKFILYLALCSGLLALYLGLCQRGRYLQDWEA